MCNNEGMYCTRRGGRNSVREEMVRVKAVKAVTREVSIDARGPFVWMAESEGYGRR